MLGDLNKQMRGSSHNVLRQAVEQVFNMYFTPEVVEQLETNEINLLSDALAYKLIKEVENEMIHRTLQIQK